MNHEQIAEVCHEANRAYCRTIGDNSHPAWADAPEWQQKSAIAGVSSIALDPSTTPDQSHAGWMTQKLCDGWKYGPTKDPEKKEHPCMVPYDELPEFQRMKDHLFGAVARTLLGAK